MTTLNKDGIPIITFPTKADLRAWLDDNHERSTGIWMRLYKKASGQKSIVWAEAVEVALCYGWIDSVVNKYDEVSYIQKLTPRRARSIWSKINCATAERLINEKLMRPTGLAQVEAAKADGRWDAAYDSPKDMVIPDDFIALVQSNPNAYAFYQTLNKSNLYAIAFRLQTAKRPETRLRRIAVILEKLERHEKLIE